MTTFLQKRVLATTVDTGLAAELAKAQTALNAIRAQIEKAFRASEIGVGLEAIASLRKYHEAKVTISWPTAESMQVTIGADEDFEAKNKFSPPALNLGEKTINTLLNGKLLTEPEKRALIVRLTDGVIAKDGLAR